MTMRTNTFPAKKAVFFLVTLAFILISCELLLSALFLYRYRILQSETFLEYEASYSSLITAFHKVGVRFGVFDSVSFYERKQTTDPAPFFVPDQYLGYKAAPGLHVNTYSRRKRGAHWEHFKVRVTINSDGSRYTGNTHKAINRNMYIFGDSLVFGEGVNDEQTFSFLLQQARPDFNVKLFALGGYSTIQNFLTFNKLKTLINSDDIVILGYADFFDERNVVAPSRLREIEGYYKNRAGRLPDAFLLPKASIQADKSIHVTYVQQVCAENRSYCDQKDPPQREMTAVTAALINSMARGTSAKVYLLHLSGDRSNPLFSLLDDRITRISALKEDFDYLVHDNIEGFDPHPGPYWHYAISRKLLGAIGP